MRLVSFRPHPSDEFVDLPPRSFVENLLRDLKAPL